MWKEKLEEIIQEKALYGEKVNSGALEKEIKVLNEKVAAELDVILPDEYIGVLEIINGIEYNGFMIYGIDEGLLEESPNQHINGLIELNKIWYENEQQKQYLFLGESSISWYVYDLLIKKYYELDNPSGQICDEFCSFELLVEKILRDALM